MKLRHYKITQEKWNDFSKDKQILNIATELCRIYQAELHQNISRCDIKNTHERALELIDLTLHDQKWRRFHQLYELRDSIATLYLGRTNPIIVKFFYTWLMNLSKGV